MNNKVAIVGHGISGCIGKELVSHLNDRDIVVIDTEGKTNEEIENEVKAHQVEPIVYQIGDPYRQLAGMIPQEKSQKPTCNKHHEYVKTAEGYECRFCNRKL
jgi:nucleoside-diphosphate-sugar epimerase